MSRREKDVRVTLEMVAAQAGVSKGTASRALNNTYGVSESTRLRVEEASAALGFVHDETARSLATGRSGIIGLLTSDLDGRFAIPIMRGAERTLSSHGGGAVLLINARGQREIEEARARQLRSRRIDGVLVVGDRSDPRPPLSTFADLPVVYAYAPSTAPEDQSITSDDAGGGGLAARHLLERGSTDLVYIAGDMDFVAARNRLAGIESVLVEHGRSLRVAPINTGWTDHDGRAAVAGLLSDGISFDGVMCGADALARGALMELQAAGVLVPEEVRVIGFDNAGTVSPWTVPPLTSVDLQLELIGERAAELLLQVREGTHDGTRIELVPSTLVIRDSTR